MNTTDVIDGLLREAMGGVTQAAAKQDLAALQALTRRATELKQMKEQIAAIDERVKAMAGVKLSSAAPAPETGRVSSREVFVEVTQGMINQNLLTVTEALRQRLLQRDEEMVIEVIPGGQKFSTKVLAVGNKLQERGEIGRFYRVARVNAGDFVLLREISPGRWQLLKCDNPPRGLNDYP